jgi:hypothetical protein
MEEKKEILLKQYETCQQDNQAQASRYWAILGIFISINTPIIGGLVVVLFNTNLTNAISNIADFSMKLPILFISLVGIFLITKFLQLWLNRVYYIVQNNTQRILEIEIELDVWKELPMLILDKWNKIRRKPKYKTKPCDHQNNEIWVGVWRELSLELSKDHFDSIYKEKARIEAMPYQERGVYAGRMEYKAAYVFWGIFSLWGILLAHLMVLSSFSLLKYWALLLYIPILIGMAWDYRDVWKREHIS